MLVGGVICAIGTLITLATYSASSANGGTYVMAWGAILFGGFRFLKGLAAYLWDSTSSEEEVRGVDPTLVGFHAVLRAMVAVAAADGEIDDTETTTIAAVFASLTGKSVSPLDISTAAREIRRSGFGSTVASYRRRVPRDLVPVIIQASHIVAMSNGTMSDEESRQISEIARTFGVTQEQQQAYIASVEPN